MSKNTGDGELDELLKAFFSERWDGWINSWDVNGERAYRNAKTAIKKYAAQEANKAQRQLLNELMEQLPDDTIVAIKYGYHSREKKYGFRMGIHEAKSVIQNKLEGLS